MTIVRETGTLDVAGSATVAVGVVPAAGLGWIFTAQIRNPDTR
ncbi:MAG: hypothetical protein OXI81_08925 [Paracoccaceae bacterium]|nr:hypothetical protein [Paracoccaceae bacterium]